MGNNMKFTQEVKDNWLNALKSGKYIQGHTILTYKQENITRHCCLGVLGEIHPNLSNLPKDHGNNDPYKFIRINFNNNILDKIWMENDITFNENNPDYSNVILLIESLETNS